MYEGWNAQRNVQGQNTNFPICIKKLQTEEYVIYDTQKLSLCLQDMWYMTWKGFNLHIFTAAC